jgi:hypothetical protein
MKNSGPVVKSDLFTIHTFLHGHFGLKTGFFCHSSKSLSKSNNYKTERQILFLRHGWIIKDCVITAMLWTSGGDLF